MAIFQNQATLTYNDNTVNSNIVTGEIVEVLSITKASLNSSYSTGDTVTYITSVINSGSTAFSGITLTDNLGGYEFGTRVLYPLTYVEGSAALFVNGLRQPVTATVTDGQLVLTGITIPADSNILVSYQARVNNFAPLAPDSEIVNTVTLTAPTLSSPIEASATLPVLSNPLLSITKSLSPDTVPENGQLTYTLTILNTGSQPAQAGVTVTDTFDPMLSDITVTYNGTPWAEGVNYTYDEATGVFTTLDGQITVPAADFVQDVTTGLWTVTPGVAVIRITGTV